MEGVVLCFVLQQMLRDHCFSTLIIMKLFMSFSLFLASFQLFIKYRENKDPSIMKTSPLRHFREIISFKCQGRTSTFSSPLRNLAIIITLDTLMPFLSKFKGPFLFVWVSFSAHEAGLVWTQIVHDTSVVKHAFELIY